MNDFDARLKRLEQRLQGNGGQRRAELLRRFAGPEYAGHRGGPLERHTAL